MYPTFLVHSIYRIYVIHVKMSVFPQLKGFQRTHGKSLKDLKEAKFI